MNPNIRDMLIREIGCIACRMDGTAYKIEAEKHHLLTTGLHGNGKRLGEDYTLGLCTWHHRGVPFWGHTEEECIEAYGPSYGGQAREFREKYGDDETLLAYQNKLIADEAKNMMGIRL